MYRNVKIDGDTITGEHDNYGGWMSFRADPALLRISMVMEGAKDVPLSSLAHDAARKIWSLQDGAPGIKGYDWSCCRDSSNEAIAAMEAVARTVIPDSEFHRILGVA